MRKLHIVALAAVAACALGAGAAAQTAHTVAAAPQPEMPVYHPSMGDMMTMLVQPRHIKLGLAIRAKNWDYAAYEVGELRGAFRRVAATIPTYNKSAVADLIASTIAQPLDALRAAIKAHDAKSVDADYAELTRSCDACHMSQGHGNVVIREPRAAMFPDQDFRPQRAKK